MAGPLDFTQSDNVGERAGEDPTLTVDVDGFEGPLDLLLELARRQKVDLARISVLALAEQYLAFIEAAGRLRLELAADYLVMAAWLAYLKSRLLLPEQTGSEEPPAADLASALAFRLKRLEAMRAASAALEERQHLGRDVFGRGEPEGVRQAGASRHEASLFDLLSAYCQRRQTTALSQIRLPERTVWTLAQARGLLERLVGPGIDWTALDGLLAGCLEGPGMAATVRASSFSATLELVKEGRLHLRQDKPFAPIYIRGGGA